MATPKSPHSEDFGVPRRGGMLNSEGKKPGAKPYSRSETSEQPRLRPQV